MLLFKCRKRCDGKHMGFLHLTPEAHQSLAEAVAQKIRCIDAKESDEEEGKHEY